MNSADGGLALIYVIVFVFLLILAILWFLLPFAIFGTKQRLDEMLRKMEDVRLNLEVIAKSVEAAPSVQMSPFDDTRHSHDELMAHYKISNDGTHYIFAGKKYASLDQAIDAARRAP